MKKLLSLSHFNNYRMLLQEKYPSLPIHHLAVQVVNRESGLKKDSLNWNTPVILIPIVEDKLIREFFKLKKQKVDLAFEINWAPKCSEEESWKGRKCKDYCDVSETCESCPEQEITDNWLLLDGKENIVKNQIKDEIKEFIINNRQLQSDLF